MSLFQTLSRMLVVLTLVVSTQGLLMVQGMFLLRQEYVASMLCVNRFNPDSDCNGKCYLKQQMAHHDGMDHSGDNHEDAPALLEVALNVRALLASAASVAPGIEHRAGYVSPVDEQEPTVLWVSGVFHPPRVG